MSAICARLGSKGKVGVQRGRETAGVPSFLPPRRAPQRSRRPQTANPPAEVQRKNSRPLGANTPAAVRAPRSVGAEKGAAPSGRTRLRQFAHPAQPVQKRSRPDRANMLTQFEYPTQPVQKKEPPRQGEHASGSSRTPLSRCRERSRPVRANPLAAVRVPRSAGAA